MVVILLQTVTRYVFFYSLPWSEELSRYLFVWMIMLGINIGIRDDMQVRIDIIDKVFKGRGKIVLAVFQQLVSLIVSAVFFYSSFNFIAIGARQLSPAMQIPMRYIYLCLPVGLGIAMLEILRKLVSAAKGELDEV
ncbi:2,3-diketo-L-gulonate TRAP transporter small permease protein YiaM [Clostridium formicaceticum]|nr:2,3-diketo-L-gulonate TRAP transporter small permease protein YiaM [Clostridium formicaceticum]